MNSEQVGIGGPISLALSQNHVDDFAETIFLASPTGDSSSRSWASPENLYFSQILSDA